MVLNKHHRQTENTYSQAATEYALRLRLEIPLKLNVSFYTVTHCCTFTQVMDTFLEKGFLKLFCSAKFELHKDSVWFFFDTHAEFSPVAVRTGGYHTLQDYILTLHDYTPWPL